MYVLGELPSAEASEVEVMATSHPEVQQEIAFIQNTYEALAHQLPMTPRPELKSKIIEQLTGTVPSVAAVSKETPSSSNGSVATSTEPPTRQRSLLPFQLGIAASVVVALLAAGAAFYFRSQWKETEQELDQVVAQNQEVATQFETSSQEAERLKNDLSIVESPDFQQIALAGTDLSPSSSAKVYWNRNSSQVYLNAGNLPTPPDDQQYQLWAIVDGQPVSAGVLDVDRDEQSPLQAMSSDIADAAAFAITLEPRGGSESPTLEAMYVLGNVADS